MTLGVNYLPTNHDKLNIVRNAQHKIAHKLHGLSSMKIFNQYSPLSRFDDDQVTSLVKFDNLASRGLSSDTGEVKVDTSSLVSTFHPQGGFYAYPSNASEDEKRDYKDNFDHSNTFLTSQVAAHKRRLREKQERENQMRVLLAQSSTQTASAVVGGEAAAMSPPSIR